jgi:hypothetical protein
MNEDDLRIAIVRGRRITRDPGLLALLDVLEQMVETRSKYMGPGPSSEDDRRIKRAMYMKRYMRDYRRGKRRRIKKDHT